MSPRSCDRLKSFANVGRGLPVRGTAPTLRAFNREPQSAGLGLTSRGAYAFPTNVVHFQRKITEASQLRLSQASAFRQGLLTEIRSEGKFLGNDDGSRIESVVRIEYALDAAHEFEIDGGLCFFKKAAL